MDFFEVWLLICNHVWSSRKDQEWAFLFALAFFKHRLRGCLHIFASFFRRPRRPSIPSTNGFSGVGAAERVLAGASFPCKSACGPYKSCVLVLGVDSGTCILQCRNTCCKPKSTAVPRKADQYSFSSIISYTFALLEGICFQKVASSWEQQQTWINMACHCRMVGFAIGHLLSVITPVKSI